MVSEPHHNSRTEYLLSGELHTIGDGMLNTPLSISESPEVTHLMPLHLKEKTIKIMVFASAWLLTFTVFYLWPFNVNAQDWSAPSAFYELHKRFPEGAIAAQISLLRDRSSGPDAVYILPHLLEEASEVRRLSHSVGRLDVLLSQGGSAFASWTCTAILIGDRIILTALHCIQAPTFRAGDIALVMEYYSDIQVQAPRFSIRLDPLVDSQELDALDVVILEVDDGSVENPYVNVRYRDPVVGETLFIVGHPLGQGMRISSGHCRVASLGTDFFNHTCATFGGSSGSPVFAATDNALLGVHLRAGVTSNTARLWSSVAHYLPDSVQQIEVAVPQSIDMRGHILSFDQTLTAIRSAIELGEVGALEIYVHEGGASWEAILSTPQQMTLIAEALSRVRSVNVLEDLLQSGLPLGDTGLGRLSLEITLNRVESPDGMPFEIASWLLRHNVSPPLSERGLPLACDPTTPLGIVNLLRSNGHTC